MIGTACKQGRVAVGVLPVFFSDGMIRDGDGDFSAQPLSLRSDVTADDR